MSHGTLRSTGNRWAFAFLLGCCVVMIVRPGEMHPALEPLPIYESLILGALIFASGDLVRTFRWHNLTQQPTTLCAVGVWFAVLMSHLSRFYLYGVVDGGIKFLKTLLFFALAVALTDTVGRLRRVLGVLAISATVMVGLCVVDYLHIYDFDFITPIEEVDGVTTTNEQSRTSRMRGTGIFQDPNDISLLIVFSGVISTYFLTDRSSGSLRFGWLGPLGVLAVGLLCTKSRGGLLGAGTSFLSLVICRFGWPAAMAAGVLGLAAASVIAGRQANIDFEEGGTGHERITLWREGLMALRSPFLLFGIGQGMYADWAGLVAHNSFVHAFVELGLIGGTLFVGCFFFPALSLWRMRMSLREVNHPELVRLYPFVVAMLAGWTMGLQSLSRAYEVSTFLMLGTQVAYLNLAGFHHQPRRLLTCWDRPHLLRLTACSAMLFVGFNLFVIVFAR